MAEILDNFDFGKRKKYPWKTWSDGKIYKVLEGEDYDSFTDFRHLLYNQADRKDLKVRINENKKERSTVFQFYYESKE